MDITKHYNFYNYVVDALKNTGGSATNEEIIDNVIALANLDDEKIEKLHAGGPRTVLYYQISWAKTYLKHAGYLESSKRGIWKLTEKGISEEIASAEEITDIGRRKGKGKGRKKNKNSKEDQKSQNNETLSDEAADWINDLTDKLMNISPKGFERICQRLFREKGFVKVEVTGRTGDGGIDGMGTLKLSLLSFKVLFQCKRYRGSVGAREIRDFRGAMSGRADKGIFLTTGHFTKSAKAEAARDGAEPIELVDGVEICNLFKELKLGVSTEEIVVIDSDWFKEYL